MYGAGNEPTTVEQFRQDFPEEMYDYKPYSIIPSYKKSLTCNTKNLFDYTSVNGLKYTKVDVSLNDFLIINGNSFTVQFGAYKASACFTPLFILKAGTYTLSLIAKGTAAGKSGVFGIIKFNSDGTLTDLSARWESSNSRQSYTFTLDEDSEVALRLQGYGNASSYNNLDSTFTDIMIELGDTATDYVPYGHL